MNWYTIYHTIFTEFSDAFNGIDTINKNDGFICHWIDFDHLFCNSFVSMTQFINIPESSQYLICDNENLNFESKKYYLYHNSNLHVEELILDGSNFEIYSFNDMETSYHIRGLIDKMLEFMGEEKNEHLRKYIGGLMHLFNGEIITIEDENINAMAIVFQVKDDVKVLQYYYSLDKKYTTLILNKILYTNRNIKLYYLSENLLTDYFGDNMELSQTIFQYDLNSKNDNY